jgi:hypothetical protein
LLYSTILELLCHVLFGGAQNITQVKNLKRMLRLISLAMIIALACTGLGIVGGVPIPEKRRRENIIELRTELKNEDQVKDETTFFYKQE